MGQTQNKQRDLNLTDLRAVAFADDVFIFLTKKEYSKWGDYRGGNTVDLFRFDARTLMLKEVHKKLKTQWLLESCDPCTKTLLFQREEGPIQQVQTNSSGKNPSRQSENSGDRHESLDELLPGSSSCLALTETGQIYNFKFKATEIIEATPKDQSVKISVETETTSCLFAKQFNMELELDRDFRPQVLLLKNYLVVSSGSKRVAVYEFNPEHPSEQPLLPIARVPLD